jgi:glycosyltransferase involved in cell wall biosynthesis
MSYAPVDAQILNRVSHSRQSSTVETGTPDRPAKTNGHRRFNTHPRNSREVPLIVHSHLGWDWVWQRPQQFISRLSETRKVLFVEVHRPDPELVAPMARLRTVEKHANITLLQMQFPLWRWHHGAWVDQQRTALVREALNGPLHGQFDRPIQWFYDPMTVSAFEGQLDEICNIYDCMDELSKFRGAPPAINEREARLLQIADVVFTGGRKLWESKSRHNSNCHFYGCGVDVEHFGKARAQETELPEDVKQLSRPVLGFFGVVDERMDYELIAKLADANRQWSVVIIGPATKIDEATLPKRPNLHWLGGRDYSQLPAYCKAFDICLMPFALNEATEYINPTKALEYMATGRNVVSTPVADVVRNFGSVVRIAHTHDEFIRSCLELAEAKDSAAIARGLDMARANSWESTVEKLEGHIADAIRIKAKVSA